MTNLPPRRRTTGMVVETLAKRHGWRRLVEVGTGRGDTMRHLLSHCPRLEYVGVDDYRAGQPEPCNPVRYKGPADNGAREYRGQVHALEQARRMERAYGNRAALFVMSGAEGAGQVPDGVLDAVLLDADFRPDALEADIRLWLPKLAEGGWVLGRDHGIPAVRAMLQRLLPGWQKLDDGVFAMRAARAGQLIALNDQAEVSLAQANDQRAAVAELAMLHYAARGAKRGPGRPPKMAA